MSTKPDYLKGLPRSRKDIVKWLLSEASWTQRGGHNYDNGTYLFCFDVKLRHVKMTFDHLSERFVSPDGSSVHDKTWIDNCRKLWNENYENDTDRQQVLYDYGVEFAKSDFQNNGVEDSFGSIPDDEALTTLHDGTKVAARYKFMGRSGGWLVLSQFNNLNCTWTGLGCDLQQDLGRAYPLRFLRHLTEIVAYLSYRLSGRKPEEEVEYQIANLFFGQICANVYSPLREQWAAEARKKSRMAFLQKLMTPNHRAAATLLPVIAQPTAMPKRRAVKFIGDLPCRKQSG